MTEESRLRSDHEFWDELVDKTERTWVLPSRISCRIRQGQLRQMHSFLFRRNGNLLDIGCGVGWVGSIFARSGMHVLGVDVSTESLARAHNYAIRAKLENIRFRYLDLRKFDAAEIGPGRFDSAVSYAVLFYLQDNQETIVAEIKTALKEQGRLYLYEPITYGKSSYWEKAYAFPVSVLRRALAKGRFLTNIPVVVRESYPSLASGFPPAELEKVLSKHFVVERVDYWHMQSQALAEICAVMKQPLQFLFTPWIRPLALLDRVLLKSAFFRTRTSGWIMASYCCVKRTDENSAQQAEWS